MHCEDLPCVSKRRERRNILTAFRIRFQKPSYLHTSAIYVYSYFIFSRSCITFTELSVLPTHSFISKVLSKTWRTHAHFTPFLSACKSLFSNVRLIFLNPLMLIRFGQITQLNRMGKITRQHCYRRSYSFTIQNVSTLHNSCYGQVQLDYAIPILQS